MLEYQAHKVRLTVQPCLERKTVSARDERRSVLITANQPFGEWNRVLPDPAMALAAVDQLVHHPTIFEMNVESYQRRSAM